MTSYLLNMVEKKLTTRRIGYIFFFYYDYNTTCINLSKIRWMSNRQPYEEFGISGSFMYDQVINKPPKHVVF